MSLFDRSDAKNLEKVMPLASRMRPLSLEEFAGQKHFLGEGKLLWRLLKANRLSSVIFYGPPGCGKTTLSKLLASEVNCRFRQLNASSSSVADLRKILSEARDRAATTAQRTLLFIDEIHRFNKSQQDVLLPDVEDGIVILVGATTQNPFFALTNALVSRSQIFQFEPLSTEDIAELLQRASKDPDRGLGKRKINLHSDAIQFLAEVSDGDARRALGAFELAILSTEGDPIEFDLELAQDSIQKKAISYDATGDEHYDVISALIKSIRGSDADAALYWLACMLEAGDEVRFISRRLIILASEDIGNAHPQALVMATAVHQACETVGLPECQLALAQAVTYLALAPKSNAVTTAIAEARKEIQQGRILPVPIHLRDKHYKGAKQFGHGQNYVYAHNHPDGFVAQDYLGVDREFYQPVDRGYESELGTRLQKFRAHFREIRKKSS